jgi:hypothetical protein
MWLHTLTISPLWKVRYLDQDHATNKLTTRRFDTHRIGIAFGDNCFSGFLPGAPGCQYEHWREDFIGLISFLPG